VRRRPSVRALARRRSGCERGGGGCRKIGFQADRKNRQQAVAHIFEQFAVVLVCGGNVSASVVKPRISDSQIAAWIAFDVRRLDLRLRENFNLWRPATGFLGSLPSYLDCPLGGPANG
jgi:hypothetical protein